MDVGIAGDPGVNQIETKDCSDTVVPWVFEWFFLFQWLPLTLSFNYNIYIYLQCYILIVYIYMYIYTNPHMFCCPQLVVLSYKQRSPAADHF